MEILILVTQGLTCVWFITAVWFFAMARLRNMGYEASFSSAATLYRELGPWVAIPLLAVAPIGLVCDTLFNVFFGSVFFRELPKEWTFSDRVKRWSGTTLGTDLRRHHMGMKWKAWLNAIMPGHI